MANQCMVVWEDVSRPPLDLLCLPMSGKCHWEVSRHVRNCCADNCYGWTPGATVYHAIFTVSRIRMLSQSQTMVFRRCAWRLLHSSADFRKKPLPQCSRTPVSMNASQTGRTWLLRTTLKTLPNTMAVSRETHVSNNHSEKGNQKKGLRDPA